MGNNTYILMRHGGAISNKLKIAGDINESFSNPLTKQGRRTVEIQSRNLKKYNIDLIVASPVLRTSQTAQIVSKVIKAPVKYDRRLREMGFGVFDNRPETEYGKFMSNPYKHYYRKPKGGESVSEVRKRTFKVVQDLEKRYSGKKILIVTHGGPIVSLASAMLGVKPDKLALHPEKWFLNTGKFIEVPLRSL